MTLHVYSTYACTVSSRNLVKTFTGVILVQFSRNTRNTVQVVVNEVAIYYCGVMYSTVQAAAVLQCKKCKLKRQLLKLSVIN